MIDEFGFQIGPDSSASEEIKTFTKIILNWHRSGLQQMNAEDVLNYLIEESVITYDEVRMLMNEKPSDIELPKIRYFFT